MTNLEIYKATIQIYEELYMQATLKRNYLLRETPVVQQQLTAFADFVLKQYGSEEATVDLLIRYFEWQFSRFVGVQTRYGANSILLHWLIGKKAMAEWVKRDPRKNWLVKVKVKKEFQLKLYKAFAIEKQTAAANALKEEALATNPTEEKLKLKHDLYNKPEGLVWCGTLNTLFNPTSELCLACTNQEACRHILQREYPKTYKIRIKAWQQQQQ